MPKHPAYFDSQAQAAAVLNIDIYKLRDAKREGCPAFRSGRVYHDELLDWFGRKRQRRELTASSDAKVKKRQKLIACTFLNLMECANADLLTDDQFFDIGKTIVETAGDELILEGFIGIMFQFVADNFPELSDAHKAHPKIVDWLCAQGGTKYGPPAKSATRCTFAVRIEAPSL